MKGKKLIAALLLFAMMVSALTGCSDNTEDILGKVGESAIYRWYYNAYLLEQLERYYQQNGVNLTTPEHKDELKQYKEYRLYDLVGEFAMREEARKLGYDQLTEEQEREIDLQYQEYYNEAIEGYLAEYGADEEGRRKAEQAYIDLLKRSTLTPERLRQNFRDQYILKLYMDDKIAEQAVSEEEVRAYYDEHVKTEQENCQNDPAWFGRNVTNASVYIPEGYYDTARITKKLNNAQTNQLKEKGNAHMTKQIEFMGAYSSDPDSADTKRLSAELEAAEKEYDRVKAEIYGSLKEELEAIRQEVLAGEDFIKTMELKSDDMRRISYYVSKDSDHLDEAYKEAALKLEAEGDVSEVIELDEGGVCIIRLMEKLEAGVRPYEEVSGAIRTQIQSMRSITLQLELMDQLSAEAEEAGIVTLYPNKL